MGLYTVSSPDAKSSRQRGSYSNAPRKNTATILFREEKFGNCIRDYKTPLNAPFRCIPIPFQLDFWASITHTSRQLSSIFFNEAKWRRRHGEGATASVFQPANAPIQESTSPAYAVYLHSVSLKGVSSIRLHAN